MKRIRFIIPGKPKGKERPRTNNRGSVYTPKNTKDYEKFVGVMCRNAGGREIAAKIPVKVHIKAVYTIPKSTNKAMRELMQDEKIFPVVKPDIDNVIKIIFDGLNGTMWHDDAQIVSVTAEKVYGDEPRVIVTVEELPSVIDIIRRVARGKKTQSA